ncbi:cytosine deaminase [Saxophila tyrrhenica]|uniref:Cytosine deaminase n=1 Tax=Saxophila tyrrhenica TaxID=1690608 RepID=A0AAV9PNN5_9PEZI|nr:cytosine deaminase [Saxophila tyrrhenica]
MSAQDEGYQIALQEAKIGAAEGGFPVGACIVSKDGKVIGRGRNMRQQSGSPILHGETAAFDSERGLPTSAFHGATLYTTMSPCWMCTGASVWFQVGRVVIGDSTTYTGPEDVLRNNGIEVVVLNTEECINISKKFIENSPEKWSDTVR